MPDPKFEEQVQQQMEELQFSPSAAVWKNLETELDKDKKRRRPIFWFFLFAGLVFGGGILYVGTMRHTAGASTTGRLPEAGQSTIVNDRSTGSAKNTSSNRKNAATAGKSSGNSDSLRQDVDRNEAALNENAKEKSNPAPVLLLTKKAARKKDHPQMTANSTQPVSAADAKDKINESLIPGSVPETDSMTKGTAAFTQSKATTTIVTDSNKLGKAGLAIKASDTAAALAKTSQKMAKKTSRLSFGFSISPGISAQQSSLFTNANLQVKSGGNNIAFAVPLFYNSTAAAQPSVYTFRPSFSWSAGLSVRRNMSKHWDLSAALNYHYSSTTITAGASVANTYSGLALNAANFNKLADYRNSFHFIDIPVQAGYTLNKKSHLPLRFEAGLVVSEFLTGRGLEYDNGLSYGKYSMLNKTQLSATFGIQLELTSGRNLFEIGPQIQYGLTDLMKTGDISAQHLLYTGLTLRIMRRGR